MQINYTEPTYTIGIAAKSLMVSVPTLRIWERKGLVKPARIGKNRFYSQCDLDSLDYVKGLLRKNKINIEGVKNILSMTKCWELKKCAPKERDVCPVYLKFGRGVFFRNTCKQRY